MSCCEKLLNKFRNGAGLNPALFEPRSACGQNRKHFSIRLNSRNAKVNICRILIDEGLIKDARQSRCDYVFHLCEDERYFFVELKGTDWPKPYEQILVTIDYFQKAMKLQIPKNKIVGVIVRSGGGLPKASTAFNKKIDEFKKKYGSDLIVATGKCEIRVILLPAKGTL